VVIRCLRRCTINVFRSGVAMAWQAKDPMNKRTNENVICVNLFARRQHLFDIAAKLINVDSNFLLYPAPFCLFQFGQKCKKNVIIYRKLFVVMITTRDFNRNPCSILTIYSAQDGKTGQTDRRRDRQTTKNIMSPVQHNNDLGYCLEVAALRQSNVTKEFYINDASREKVTSSELAT